MSIQIYDHAEKGDYKSYALLSDGELEPVVAKPASLSDIWRAANTWTQAFLQDPYVEYLEAGSKSSLRFQRVGYAVTLLLWLKNQIIFTAEGGYAVNVDIHYPSKTRSRIDKLRDKMVTRFWEAASSGKKTPEQVLRNTENREKMVDCVKACIPAERYPEMYQVALMAADPEQQGRGLGSAVLHAMTEIADKEGRACWLLSSNVQNNAFYNSHGFFTVGSYLLGEQNPTWTKKPVQVQIMVREPKTAIERPTSNVPPKSMVVLTPSGCYKLDA